MMFKSLFKSFLRSRDGNTAVEFALTAPMLAIMFVLMADVGIAVSTQMEMDRNVRAGVQATMSAVSDTNDIGTMVLASSNASPDISISVSKICTCGEVSSSCTQMCGGGEPPSVFMNISATQPYNGFMLPSMTLRSKTHVQLR